MLKRIFMLIVAIGAVCFLCACGGRTAVSGTEEQTVGISVEQTIEETEEIEEAYSPDVENVEEVYTPTVEEIDEIVGVWSRNATQYNIYFEFYPDGSGLYTTKSGDYYNVTWSKNEYNGLYTICVDRYEGVSNFTRTFEIQELPNVSRTEYYTCFSLEGEVYQKEA